MVCREKGVWAISSPIRKSFAGTRKALLSTFDCIAKTYCRLLTSDNLRHVRPTAEKPIKFIRLLNCRVFVYLRSSLTIPFCSGPLLSIPQRARSSQSIAAPLICIALCSGPRTKQRNSPEKDILHFAKYKIHFMGCQPFFKIFFIFPVNPPLRSVRLPQQASGTIFFY